MHSGDICSQIIIISLAIYKISIIYHFLYSLTLIQNFH